MTLDTTIPSSFSFKSVREYPLSQQSTVAETILKKKDAPCFSQKSTPEKSLIGLIDVLTNFNALFEMKYLLNLA